MFRKLCLVALTVMAGIGFSACLQPVGQSGYKLVWADEFDGDTLDATKWNDGWFNTVNGSRYTRPVNSLEDGCFDRNLSNVSGGYLHLGSGTNSDPDCQVRCQSGSTGTCPTAPYRGAHVDTNPSWSPAEGFQFTYGYVEARIRFPGDGTVLHNWPVFWTNGQNWPEDCEFDVAEVLSDHQPSWHIHHPGTTVNGDPDGNWNGWHTYGLEWKPDSQRFFYDGQLAGSASVDCTAPHYFLLGHQINVEYGVHVPTVMQVDYVRAWRAA